MNKYTKPTFMLASLGVTALAAASGCSYVITDADKEVFDIWAPGWKENGFHPDEGCSIPIDKYCKFTASDSTTQTILKAFGS